MLKTETNTPEMEHRVINAFPFDEHRAVAAVFEHGQWWITCNDCGGQWSVVDATGGRSIDGFDFEEVGEGDESC